MDFAFNRRGFIAASGVALLGGAGVLGNATRARADTDPTKPALENVHVASQSGNTITLAWDAPPAGEFDFWWFYVFDNGAKEAVIGTGSNGTPTRITMRRLPPGTTHEFTIIYGDFIGLGDSAKLSPPSEPVRVTLPPSADTVPPTTPPNVRIEAIGDGTVFVRKWDPSTDDVTPQEQLQYDFVDWTGFTLFYGVESGMPEGTTGSVRAVDEAGNRSPLSGA